MGVIENIFKIRKYGEICRSINNKSDYKEFKTDDDAERWGNRHYNEWAERYKKQMLMYSKVMPECRSTNPIESYCGYSSRTVNEFLRSKPNDSYNIERELALLLTISLCNAPRIPERIVVYRLVCNEFIEDMIKNNKNKFIPTEEKGFLSTSLTSNIVNSNEAYALHKNLLKIYVDIGLIGIYVNPVARRIEQEILMCCNSYLAMIDYPYKDKNLGKTVYECTLLHI